MKEIDISRLITVANFAKLKGVTRQTVYCWLNKNEHRSLVIDGVMFVFADLSDVREYQKIKKIWK